MIQYRRFRNTDPPALAEVWNDAFPNRGAFAVRSANLFEHAIFSKPYFDPKGLIIAEEDGRVIGFVHAGLGPNAAETDLAIDPGIICAIAVRSEHRRHGIGSELLRQAEEYLRKLGSTQFMAGGMRPQNPFYFGIYGGSDSPGFLASDPGAGPFFEHHGYQGVNACLIYEMNLDQYDPPADSRFLNLRRKYDVQLLPQPELTSWWQDCVLGQVEPVEFRLTDKLSGIPEARILAWEMSSLRQPSPPSAGLLDINVRADVQRQGLARFLLSQMFRYIQEQYFRMVEVHIPEANDGAIALFHGLGFDKVDVGRSYRRGASGEPKI